MLVPGIAVAQVQARGDVRGHLAEAAGQHRDYLISAEMRAEGDAGQRNDFMRYVHCTARSW